MTMPRMMMTMMIKEIIINAPPPNCPNEWALMIKQLRVQVPSDDDGRSGYHQCCCTYRVPRKKEWDGEKKRRKIINKNEKTTKGAPLRPRAFLLCFLNIFVVLLATSKFQGLSLVWVQLLKVVHEKKYKNIEIAKKTSSVNQNPQTNDVCTLSKTLA